MALTAREAALKTLIAVRKNGAWADAQLKSITEEERLDARDAALASRLCYGVLQNRLLLDFYLSAFSTIKLEKLEPAVLDILRLAVCQLKLFDRIPPSAAVNEAVKMARARSNPRAAAFVNAVLRKIARTEILPEPGGGESERLSVKYSHPAWLVEEFISALGTKQAGALLEKNNEVPPVTAQVNTLKTDAAAVRKSLGEDGVSAAPHPWLEDCLELGRPGDVAKLRAFTEGEIIIQDAGARLCAMAAGPKPGDFVVDACAAPGGKTFNCAMMMENKGRIVSCDIHERKLGRLRADAERLGAGIVETRLSNGRERDESLCGRADVVLADVPCSGLGVIRKKPEIRYKDRESLAGLPEAQRGILDNVSGYVRPGGVLLYSTCTLLRAENEDVISAFLEKHPEFTPEGFELPGIGGAGGGMVTLYPHVHGTDGFFLCRLRRTGGGTEG